MIKTRRLKEMKSTESRFSTMSPSLKKYYEWEPPIQFKGIPFPEDDDYTNLNAFSRKIHRDGEVFEGDDFEKLYIDGSNFEFQTGDTSISGKVLCKLVDYLGDDDILYICSTERRKLYTFLIRNGEFIRNASWEQVSL